MQNNPLTPVQKTALVIESAPTENPQRQQRIDEQADQLIDQLWDIEPRDLRKQQQETRALGSLAQSLQASIARKSAMLKQPMARLMEDAEDGGEVATALIKLEDTIAKINPNQFDFDMSWFRRLLGKLPGVGSTLRSWIVKYQLVDSVVQNIINDLKAGRDQLRRDNITLSDDQLEMRELTFQLQDYIQFGQQVDARLVQRLETDTQLDDKRRKFLEEEILFTLRQRILDLQNQLAVNQQGVLTTEVIIRNNKELMRGVERSLNVTVTALQTAASLTLALSNQKRVLSGVQAITSTTNDMIAQTAEKLKTQGAEIQKQAASSQLDLDTLKRAFSDVEAALNDISTFRQEALPQMAQSVLELDELNGKMEDAINQMEQAGEQGEALLLDLHSEPSAQA